MGTYRVEEGQELLLRGQADLQREVIVLSGLEPFRGALRRLVLLVDLDEVLQLARHPADVAVDTKNEGMSSMGKRASSFVREA